MYRVAVHKDFVAQHFLVGGDWGEENHPHSHHYQMELELAGATLDQHGYMVDIVEINRMMDELVCRYRDHLLNDLSEFAGLNPSIEHFTRILCEQFNRVVSAKNITRLTVRLWENEIAWAAYELER